MTVPQKGNSGPIFARPLKPIASPSATVTNRLWTLRPTPGLAFTGLVTIAVAALLLPSRPDGAQNLVTSPKKSTTTSGKRVRVALADLVNPGEKATESGRPALNFYTKGVRGSMFSAPVPPKPKEAIIPKPTRVIVPIVMPQIINPFLDWVYAGSVTAGVTGADGSGVAPSLKVTRSSRQSFAASVTVWDASRARSITTRVTSGSRLLRPTRMRSTAPLPTGVTAATWGATPAKSR